MKCIKVSARFVLTVIAGLFIMSMWLNVFIPTDNLPALVNGGNNFQDQSADYQDPDILEDGVTRSIWLSSDLEYFRTQNVTPSYYNIVWFKPAISSVNHLVSLYLDSNYAAGSLLASNSGPNGALHWIIFRPNTTAFHYIKVTRTGPGSPAYIGWKSAINTITVGEKRSGFLNSTDMVDIFELDIWEYGHHDIILNVPDDCDFDMYLYSPMLAGSVADYSFRSSVTSGNGEDEYIRNIDYMSLGKYILVVKHMSGSGTYTLRFCEDNDGSCINDPLSPLLIFLIMAAIAGVIVGGTLVFRRYQKNIAKQKLEPIQKPKKVSKVGPKLLMGAAMVTSLFSTVITWTTAINNSIWAFFMLILVIGAVGWGQSNAERVEGNKSLLILGATLAIIGTLLIMISLAIMVPMIVQWILFLAGAIIFLFY